MATAGFADIQRGERGSTAEHLTVTEFKVAQEQKKLDALEAAANKKEAVLEKYDKRLKVQKTAALTFQEIDEMGSSSLIGKKISMTQDEAAKTQNAGEGRCYFSSQDHRPDAELKAGKTSISILEKPL